MLGGGGGGGECVLPSIVCHTCGCLLSGGGFFLFFKRKPV